MGNHDVNSDHFAESSFNSGEFESRDDALLVEEVIKKLENFDSKDSVNNEEREFDNKKSFKKTKRRLEEDDPETTNKDFNKVKEEENSQSSSEYDSSLGNAFKDNVE